VRPAAPAPAFDATLVAVDYAMPLDQLVLQLKFGASPRRWRRWFARLLRDAVLAATGLRPARRCSVRCRWGRAGWPSAASTRRWKSPGRWRAASASPCIRAWPHACETRRRKVRRRARERASKHPRRLRHHGCRAWCEGRHVGIVDDVMTSGHTLNELAATLKRHGAARVSNLVFARTPPH
jgi:predicted amidophosphoribosyltransferase